MQTTLYYVHDPMCSWCYAMRPTWARLREQLPASLPQLRLLGGLAPDTDEVMPETMQTYLQAAWRRIEEVVPGTRFNYEFWRQCRPRRMTYRACRAVIAARNQDPTMDAGMTAAIQDAYYLGARNPADADTLVGLAQQLGLDAARFAAELDADETRQALLAEIAQAREIGADSFPSIVIVIDGEAHPIALDYNRAEVMLERIQATLAAPSPA